jgi:hypothetical protein
MHVAAAIRVMVHVVLCLRLLRGMVVVRTVVIVSA